MSRTPITRLLLTFAAALFFAATFSAPAIASGKTGDACSLFYPCDEGLNCHPFVQKCFHVPRQYDEPCMAGFECGDGLSCQPGVHKCFHTERLENEPCSAGYDCAEGLNCKAGAQICVKDEAKLCKEILSCAFSTARAQLPADVCSSCSSDGSNVVDAITKVLNEPGIDTACNVANELNWLKTAVTGGAESALQLMMCKVFPGAGSIEAQACNTSCQANCPDRILPIQLAAIEAGTEPDPEAIRQAQAELEACSMHCGCGLEKLVCEQASDIIAEQACEAIGLK